MFFDDDEISWCRKVVKNDQNRGCRKVVKKVLFFMFFMISMCVDDVIKLMMKLMLWCEVCDVINLSIWWSKIRCEKMDPFWGQKKEPQKSQIFGDEVGRSQTESRSDEVFVIFVTMRSRALRVEAQRQLSWESRSDTSSVPQGFERFLSRVRSTIFETALSAFVDKDEHRRCEDRNERSDVRIAVSGRKKFSLGNFCSACTS